MDKKVLAYLSLMVPFIAFGEVDDLEVQHYNAVAGNYLSCNARLSNGRAHFAQLLFDGVGWAVEIQEVYVPERVREQDEPTEPELILEAQYEFPEGHISCRLQPYCCSSELSLYLDSCREPEVDEEAAVDSCLAEGHKRKTNEYEDCLRSNGINIGCEPQDDGSRLCY